MQSNIFITKKKIILHLLINGNKKTGEKIMLKNCKKVQKNSKKQLKNLVQLDIINYIPIFKIYVSFNKRNKKKIKKNETPAFITKSKIRNSFAIKFILKSVGSKQFFNLTENNILLTSKYDRHQQIIKNRQKIKYFKWT